MLCAPIASAAEPPCSASPECHAPPPPTLLVQPEISVEAPIVGQVVTASPGTWSHEPVSYSYQWVSCGQSYARACTQIIGAASAAYTVTEADLGARIGVEVSATNAGGTGGPAESNLSTPVSPGPYQTSMEALARVEVSIRNLISSRVPRQVAASLGLAFRSMAVGRHFVPDLERIDIEVSRAVVIRTKNLFHNDLSLRQQTIAQARCMKARCWSGSRSQRMRSLRNWCSHVKLRSTTQRWVPSPEPCSSPRRAISGLMPRAQSSRRYLSWS